MAVNGFKALEVWKLSDTPKVFNMTVKEITVLQVLKILFEGQICFSSECSFIPCLFSLAIC